MLKWKTEDNLNYQYTTKLGQVCRGTVFGYYSESQKRSRDVFARMLLENIKQIGGL